MLCHYYNPHFAYSSWYHYNLQYCYTHTPDTTVNKIGTLLFCSSSVVHMYHIACLYIGQHLYEIKWTVPLTFRPWQRHIFVIDLGATREVSRFSPKMEVWTQKEARFCNSGETSTFFTYLLQKFPCHRSPFLTWWRAWLTLLFSNHHSISSLVDDVVCDPPL